MTTIKSPYALTALRKMAEYTPERLLRMEKEEPEKLLKEIEIRVTNALGWADTAKGKGASEENADKAIDLLLMPDGIPGNVNTMPIDDQKINEIYKRLISLAEKR